jgi:hypothetical protein
MLEKGGLWFVEPRPDPRGSIPRGRRSLLACAIGSRHSVLQLQPPDQRSYELLHGKMRRETYIICSLLKRNTCSMCFMSLCGVSTTDWSPSLWCLGCTRAGSPIIVLRKIDIRSIFCFLFLMFLSACAANLAALVKHR